MPLLCEFDTQAVHPPANPQRDTRATVHFPHQLVARPRLAHGIRALDVDKNDTVRIRSTSPFITNAWADCHIETWLNTTLYQGIADIFVLTPADLDFLTGEHQRQSRDPSAVRVEFERTFVTPPRVVVFLNLIDLSSRHDWRVSVSASDIDKNGFTLHIETWGDTILYAVQACWIAYPEDREHIFSTSINTMDLESGPVTKPQPKHCRKVVFDTIGFWKTPSVFVALNFLDVDCRANLRVKGYVDGVTETGLDCHIDSWADTVLYAAGVSIIAFI